jgi:hypothetical protein
MIPPACGAATCCGMAGWRQGGIGKSKLAALAAVAVASGAAGALLHARLLEAVFVNSGYAVLSQELSA